ncbi:phosphatidylglycerophosphatase A family protein [Methylomonas sp. CM2]|uniref:phosphatidylglycerophosphatase A family protein n=1 Tax=Methylomonas sp. CM2 TaxID=3417647 RepID=UPI003CEDCC2D
MSIFFRASYGKAGLSAGDILRDVRLWLAFGFGAGLVKRAPGTFGTLAALPVYAALLQSGFWGYWLATAVVIAVGIHLCDYAAARLQVHDFGGIVWDEIAGLLLAMAWVPFSWRNLALGFALFRFFDIVKPWPIGWLDRRVHGGLGIMLDDVVAGLFAALVLVLCAPWMSQY